MHKKALKVYLWGNEVKTIRVLIKKRIFGYLKLLLA